MEISSSVTTGLMKVGLNVISNHKRPLIEFYHEIINQSCKETLKEGKFEVQRQEVYIIFTIVNIGGIRAENISFEISGDFKKNGPDASFGQILESEIPQMASGQLIQIFKLDENDLYTYKDNKQSGVKNQNLKIITKYNAPESFLNKYFTKRIFGKKQYETNYIFKPNIVCGDLPLIEHH